MTGQRVRAGSPGSSPTGRYVMRMRPAPGEPFEVVEVERDDLDPTRDMLGFDPGLRELYRRAARDAARLRRKAERERDARLRRMEKGRVKGVRATFDSPREGAEEIYTENYRFYDPIHELADPIDFLDRWFDTNEVRVGKRYKRLRQTKRGQELERLHAEKFGKEATVEALAYVLGKARGKRWENVDWSSIDDYNDALAQAFEAQREQSGYTGPWEGTFVLPVAARGLPSEEEAMAAPADQRQQFMWLHARDELQSVAGRIQTAYRRNRKCIKDAAARKTIRERIKQIRTWADDPAQIPGWACISRAVYCDFPAAHRELEEVENACSRGYDPDWPRQLSPSEAQDIGLLPGAGEGAPAAEPDLDLPWEAPAANPGAAAPERVLAAYVKPFDWVWAPKLGKQGWFLVRTASDQQRHRVLQTTGGPLHLPFDAEVSVMRKVPQANPGRIARLRRRLL